MAEVTEYIKKLYRNRLFVSDKHNVRISVKDIHKSSGIYIRNCKDCEIIVRNKITNLMLENCENCEIKFQTIISKIELLRCKKIDLNCKYTVNLIQSDYVNTAKLSVKKQIKVPQILFSSVSCCDITLSVADSNKTFDLLASMFDHNLTRINENEQLERQFVGRPEELMPFGTEDAIFVISNDVGARFTQGR